MDTLSIAFLTIGLIIIVLSNLPLLRVFTQNKRSFNTPGYYSDEDGEAIDSTQETLLQKWDRRSILGFSLIGLIITCIDIILVTLNGTDERAWILLWSQLASWILASLQSIVLSLENSITQRHNFAHCAFWTSLGLAILTALDNSLSRPHSDVALFALSITVISVAGLRAVCSVLVRRRPDVYHEGKLVDREHTVSLWSRLTFGYVTPFVNFAGKHQGAMGIENFPQLPRQARSEHLHDLLYTEQQQGQTLFSALCHTHLWALILQATLAFGYAVFSFGPQVALYGILRALEDSSIGSPGLWIAALGVTMLLSSSLNSWVWCITYSKLAIPLYSEMLALLYTKSMRKKIIHQADIAADNEEEASKLQLEEIQQEAINLVTIDTKRISDYISYNHLIPSSVTQFIIGCALLWGLIGWKALLAGVVSNIITAPGNLFIAKQYRVFQIGLMQARDERTAVVHEVVQNIRQIKFSSIESAWKDRVLEVRQREMNLNFQACFYETGFKAIWTLAPLLLSAISLTVYALQNGRLEASVAFTSIAIFGSLEVALSALPHLISTALEAKISVDRIDKYMSGPEKTPSQSSATDGIVFQDATVAWPVREGREDVGFRLSGLSFKFPVKGLTILTGKTGSGKSLLLSAVLGECDVLSGSVQVPFAQQEGWKQPSPPTDDWIIDSAIAYVAQSPWTENGTIKDNILFGLPLDQVRYRKALFASGLERDLEILSDGDQTDIGANGVNLSGGQRARVSFARVLYSRAGIIIMDDVFSALDADTSKHVYEYGLTGELAQNRTRILATHAVGLCLPKTDYCIILADGAAPHAGSVEELRKANALVEYEHRGEEKDGEHSQSVEPGREPQTDTPEGQKFSPEEQRATGSVPLRLYLKFLTGDKSAWLWTLGVLTSLLYTIFFFGRSWWLNIWTDKPQQELSRDLHNPFLAMNSVPSQVQKVKTPEDLGMYIGIYVGLSFAASLFGTLRFLFIRFASLRSSQALFKNLLSAVLAAPLRWVDTVPLGRVLNRFTADIYTLDWLLGPDLADLLMWALQAIGVMAASVTVSPIVIVPAALLLAASLKLSAVYLSAAREVKRLESVSRTPVLEQFTSSLVGLTTIRAYDQTRKYIHLMFARIDGYARVSWNLWLLNWWLQMRINFFGAIFSIIVAIIVVKLGVSASLAGFAISFLLQYSTAVSSMIRFCASFEMDMNATERVIDYADIETEPSDGLEPPAAWPTKGLVEVDNLVVGYSPELPPVLRGLTFTIESNQRVGVVGRTGSGKSTLALALFRFLEARKGSVFLDGLDTAKVNLHALRRGMAIVPQLPTLFKGTIKSNLDPFNWYSETEMNDALERVHLVSPDSGPVNSFTLDTTVSEGGANFSQGQRQLLCLARAILQRTKIMILDEATSSVDLETDGHIQEAIRSEFGRNMSSLLVIAHRLSTIADFDRILVMSDGEIVENGNPKELINIEGGVFRELINQSNEKALVEKIILG